ncbi:MAG: SDR family oxidoreductase [Pseudomonadota bacterium]
MNAESRTVLITGANRGIGLELARQYSKDDWNVIACCRNPESAHELQALAEHDQKINIYELNVTNYDQVKSLADQLLNTPIDVLLSNAGLYGSRGNYFGSVDPENWREVLEVNTIAPLMLAQAFVEHVAASEKKTIAIVSSKVGSIKDNRSGGGYVYRSSKTAVNQVVKSLSIDLAERGVCVLSLHPGWVQTDMGGPNAEITTEMSVTGLKKVLDSTDLNQSGKFIEFDGNPIPW